MKCALTFSTSYCPPMTRRSIKFSSGSCPKRILHGAKITLHEDRMWALASGPWSGYWHMAVALCLGSGETPDPGTSHDTRGGRTALEVASSRLPGMGWEKGRIGEFAEDMRIFRVHETVTHRATFMHMWNSGDDCEGGGCGRCWRGSG